MPPLPVEAPILLSPTQVATLSTTAVLVEFRTVVAIPRMKPHAERRASAEISRISTDDPLSAGN